ncbi:nitrate/nitrite transporter NrtS [Mycobacterium spongiae]|uniref:nitrate/nitrite transporter NrtS n=1 Tax=Mycobacterium spongiae TaxID=886343 RepID=UPI001BAB30A3|nr:nitrate/nitrite transporter NrtS [Mycobacterium spongiae]
MNVQPGDPGWSKPIEAVRLFLRGHTLRTAVPTAAVVGTVLCAVNQGAILIGGQVTAGTWVRISINYLVPFIVASIGYLGAHHRPRRRPHGSDPASGTSGH